MRSTLSLLKITMLIFTFAAVFTAEYQDLKVVEDIGGQVFSTVSDLDSNYCAREMTFFDSKPKEWGAVGASACPNFNLGKYIPSWLFRRGLLELDAFTYIVDIDDCGYQVKFLSAQVDGFDAGTYVVDVYYDKLVLFQDNLTNILHTWNIDQDGTTFTDLNSGSSEKASSDGGVVYQVYTEKTIEGNFKLKFYSYISNKEIQAVDSGIYFTPNSLKTTVVLENIMWEKDPSATGIALLATINKAGATFTAKPWEKSITANYSRPDESLSDQDLFDLTDGGFFSYKTIADSTNGTIGVVFSAGEENPSASHCPNQPDFVGFRRINFVFDTDKKPNMIAWDPSIGKEDDRNFAAWLVVNSFVLLVVILSF